MKTARAGLMWSGASAAVVTVLLLTGAAQARGDDSMLLEVQLGGLVVSDGVAAYPSRFGVRLPLLQLAQALSIDIRASPFPRLAAGFVVDQQRTFSLGHGTFALAGRSESFDPEMIELRDDDIFVPLPLLERWLPVKLTVEPELQLLTIAALEPLPVQARLQRAAAAARLGRSAPHKGSNPRLADERQLVSFPSLDQTVAAEARRVGGRSQFDVRSATYATGDLLGTEAAVYVAGANGHFPEDIRATLARTDPDAGLLGPLHATYVGAGAVSAAGLSNVSYSDPRWLGASASSYALDASGPFDRYSLSGLLRPGWDVELYQNGALVGYQASRVDGTYAFEELPLQLGQNDYRLVFHGPYGERSEETRSMFFGPGMSRPGQVQYRLTAQRDGTSFLRTSAMLDLGVSRQLSIAGGATVIPIEGSARGYTFAGLRASVAGVFAQADVDLGSDGGTLEEVALNARWLGLNLRVGELLAQGFTSEVLRARVDPFARRTSVHVDGVLPARLPVSFSLDARRDTLGSGASEDQASGRISANVASVSMFQTLRWMSVERVRLLDAVFRASRRLGAWNVAGQAAWEVHPSPRVESVDLRLERRLGDYLMQGSVAAEPANHLGRVALAAVRTLGAFGLQLHASCSTANELLVGMQVFFSLGREAGSGAIVADAQPMAGSGGLAARVFLDKNGNGRMDPGEPLIPGARMLVNGAAARDPTNQSGVALLRALPNYQHVDVSVDEMALEDPQWKAGTAGVSMVPRPGKTLVADFPVVPTSIIDGTVLLEEKGGGRHPLEGAELQLVDRAGTVLASTRTSYDGWYEFEGVRPGTYRIGVSADSTSDLSLNVSADHLVRAASDDVSGERAFVVTRRAKAGEPRSP